MSRTLNDYPEISINPEDLNGKIDFVRIFGRNGPVHIEIGSGKGTFLLNQARVPLRVNLDGVMIGSTMNPSVMELLPRPCQSHAF